MQMTKAKNKIKFLKILYFILFFLLIFGVEYSPAVSAQSSNTIQGVISVNSRIAPRNIWTDSMWKFYKATVRKNETLVVNMSYSGDLDIDLRFYVDENPTTQKVVAWDITHCGLDDAIEAPEKPKRNSQERGTTATEQCIYTNYIFSIPRIVYILVFCYDYFGKGGESIYTLNSNLTIQEVSSKELIKSIELTAAWNWYFIGTGVTIIIAVMISGYLRIPKKERKMMKIQKREEKQRKLEEKLAKKEKEQKQKRKTAMKKRRSSTRRFR
ncbi:MAG: hypothetical protein ACTSRZ_00015 [Promethearchaeota archaeon]